MWQVIKGMELFHGIEGGIPLRVCACVCMSAFTDGKLYGVRLMGVGAVSSSSSLPPVPFSLPRQSFWDRRTTCIRL